MNRAGSKRRSGTNHHRNSLRGNMKQNENGADEKCGNPPCEALSGAGTLHLIWIQGPQRLGRRGISRLSRNGVFLRRSRNVCPAGAAAGGEATGGNAIGSHKFPCEMFRVAVGENPRHRDNGIALAQ